MILWTWSAVDAADCRTKFAAVTKTNGFMSAIDNWYDRLTIICFRESLAKIEEILLSFILLFKFDLFEHRPYNSGWRTRPENYIQSKPAQSNSWMWSKTVALCSMKWIVDSSHTDMHGPALPNQQYQWIFAIWTWLWSHPFLANCFWKSWILRRCGPNRRCQSWPFSNQFRQNFNSE